MLQLDFCYNSQNVYPNETHSHWQCVRTYVVPHLCQHFYQTLIFAKSIVFFFKDFFIFYWLIDWLIAMLGLRFCARAFSSCGKRGPLFITVRGPLTIAASLAAEHRLQTRRLSNCGSRAQPLRGTWDLPRPGLEPVSPALAGRLSTTAPPGKPLDIGFWNGILLL